MTNSTTSRLVLVAAIVPMALTGCAISPETAYPTATSAQECQTLHTADVRATNQRLAANTGSSGNWLADAIGSGLGKGVAESSTNTRLALCLERVGGSPIAVSAPSGGLAPLPSSQPTTTTRPTESFPRCVSGNGVMVRGDGYCVGY